MRQRALKASEQGFVLATSLVMLVLLTMLSIATYYGTIISQQTSASAQESTQSFYYAETGLNYVAWALKNDAEFDGYTYPGRGVLPYEPIDRQDRYANVILKAAVVGDRREWEANKGNPSNRQFIQTSFTTGPVQNIYGQLGYFDNRPLNQRPVGLIQVAAGGVTNVYTTVFGVHEIANSRVSPTFHDIYTQLSGYIRLDIDAYGQITPSFSPYGQHGNNTHTCNGQLVADVPCNGAVVWLTAGDPYTDRVLYPIDPYEAAPLIDKYGNPLASGTLRGGNSLAWNLDPYAIPSTTYPDAFGRTVKTNLPSYYSTLSCDIYAYVKTNIACEQPMDATGKPIVTPIGGTGQWLDGTQYGLVVYAIGYSGGKARKMIRMVLN